jgi:iron(III) transport system substrate-binding protein
MKWFAIILLFLLTACARLFPSSDQLGTEPTELTIYSTTDSAAFQPVMDEFNRLHPNVHLHYVEIAAEPLYRRFLAETAARKPKADLLLSSAMDLQVKLVNDGFAAPHHSANVHALPGWAKWRSEAFGISFEPVVFVFNTKLMKGREVPRSRPQLIAALNEDPRFWRGRIGTYDAFGSSVGYLLMSQDSIQSSDYSNLMQAFGDADIKVGRHTSALLDAIQRGDLVMGYDLLGSYAEGRVAKGAPLTIVYPEDDTLAVTRTAIIPKNAPHPGAAHAFLEYLLSLEGQRVLTGRSRLNAVRQEINGPFSRMGITETTVGPLRPIDLGPGLLVYLDDQKRRQFLKDWQSMVRSPTNKNQSLEDPLSMTERTERIARN